MESRTKNTTRNIFFAIVSQLSTVVLSFFTRTALIYTLGIQAVSLNGLFTEVIAMISLAELGVGSAIVYNLYKPLAENDHKKICQLMTLFKKAYRIIALAVLGIGLILAPFITYLVNSVDYSDGYVRLVYILFVIQTASSYLFAYKASLLNADQKRYVSSIISAVVKAISVGAIIGVLLLTKNYLIYLCVQLFFNILTNVITAIYVNRKYTYLHDDNSMSKEETRGVLQNVKNLFIKTLSWRVTSSTDNILISVLVNTLQVGYYSNYNVFFNVVKQLQNQFAGGIAGSLGNLLATGENKHCDEVLTRLSYIFYCLSYAMCMVMYACISPVIQLWLGEEYLLSTTVVFILCFNLFVDFCKTPLWQVLEVSGLFKDDKNISIIGTTANLVVSIVLGLRWGMIGIFIGTTVTYLVQLFMKIRLIYKKKFYLSPQKYTAKWIFYLVSFLLGQIIMHLILSAFQITNLFLLIIVNALLACVITIVVCVIPFIKTQEFSYLIMLIQGTLRKVKKKRA